MEELRQENVQLKLLLAQIGNLIRVRDGNGKRTDRFCLLCPRLGGHRELHGNKMVTVKAGCVHSQIWQYGNGDN